MVDPSKIGAHFTLGYPGRSALLPAMKFRAYPKCNLQEKQYVRYEHKRNNINADTPPYPENHVTTASAPVYLMDDIRGIFGGCLDQSLQIAW